MEYPAYRSAREILYGPSVPINLFVSIPSYFQTYTGSILVAVNPYKMYGMYGLDMVKKYEGQILGTLPP